MLGTVGIRPHGIGGNPPAVAGGIVGRDESLTSENASLCERTERNRSALPQGDDRTMTHERRWPAAR